MIDQSHVATDHLADDPRITSALEAYIAAFESGAPMDRQQFLERHPEIRVDGCAPDSTVWWIP